MKVMQNNKFKSDSEKYYEGKLKKNWNKEKIINL